MMSKTLVFEWSKAEQLVLEQSGLVWPEATFTPTRFAIDKCKGYAAVSIFVDSKIADEDLQQLAADGIKKIAIRATGSDMLNVPLAKQLGIDVLRVASYSPESVAEHAFALLLTLVRRLNVQREHHEHDENVRDNLSLGTSLYGKVFGVYGAGRIGSRALKIATGFGMEAHYFDPFVEHVPGVHKHDSLAGLFMACDIVSIHVPLLPETRYCINADLLAQAKPGLILINVSRGDLLDSQAVIAALDSGKISALGVDVWDSGKIDDKFDKHLLRDNAVQTHHVAYFTKEALQEILTQTIDNLNGEIVQGNAL